MRVEQTVVGDRFVLEYRAGAGGMGEVYRARDQQSGQFVAVKIMRAGDSDDANRFTREARILSALRHPHIVGHVAHGVTEDERPWLAMEWLDGEDLAVRLGRGRVSLEETMRLAIDIAEGLAQAHDRGIVHRDLKPSNLFLCQGRMDDVRILDFGIAKAGIATRVTRTGMLLGTPGYMAPEQARGEQTVDARADIHSLGVVLFECLTGEPLYSGVHVAALLAKILFDEAPRVRDKLPDIPAPIEHILTRMLAKDPEHRFADAQALLSALRALGSISSAPTEPALQASWPPARSLTTGEKRSVAVIFVNSVAADSSNEFELLGTRKTTLEPALHTITHRFGARLEALVDGSIAFLLTQKTLATDLAIQAARCALALRAAFPGRTIAAAMGRADATDKSPMSHVIDRAATLCGSTGASSVHIGVDETLAGLLDARFDVREESSGLVLHDERPLAEGTRMLLGKATPCVGREREIRYIETSFSECLESSAQVVLVTAPAGVGKSRLGHEFLRIVRERYEDVAIWIARGDSLRAGSALGLLAQVVRNACGVLEGETLDVRRDKIRAAVAERIVESERKRVAEFLGELVGTPFPDQDSLPLRAAKLDALLMTEQMRTAFLDFLSSECAKHPVLLLLEDLHWGDRPTIQFLDAALRDSSDKPFFVLALSRPEIRDTFPDLWKHRPVAEMQLKELGRKPIERLVRHALGDRTTPETLDRFVRLSEGNAFYLEELIRFAAEGREGELPETVVAMVQSRLGTLDELHRRVLRAASVFGEIAWAGGVAALLGDGARKGLARENLLQLVEKELLIKRKVSRFLDEDEYAFRHALLREGAYAMLTEEDLTLGHKLAAEWLEARGEDDAILLAEHFEKGGERERAAKYYARAVNRADLAGDSTAAVEYGRRGLACTDVPQERAQILGRMCLAYTWRTELLSEALPYALELLQIATRGSNTWIQGQGIKIDNALLSGQISEFTEGVQELVTVSPSVESGYSHLFTLARAAIGLDFIGMVRESNAVMRRLNEVADCVKQRDPSLFFLPPHGMPAMRSCYAHEDPSDGLKHAEIAALLSETCGDHRFRDMAGVLLVSLNRWLLGDTQAAQRVLLGSTLPDEAFGYVSSLRPFVLAWIHTDAGQLEKAREYAERLVNAGKTRRLPLDEGRGHWALGEVLRRQGDWNSATTELETAKSMLQFVCAIDMPGVMASIAALRLAENRLPEALAIAEEAIEMYARIGACSQFFRGAYLRLVHAEILEALGRHEDACRVISEAYQKTQLNADKIGDSALRRSFLDNVPENRRTLELAKQWLENQG